METQYSVEGVNYQTDHSFFNELSKVIDEIRSRGGEGFTEIGDVICKYLGIKYMFVVLTEERGHNAMINMPEITHNHPFYHHVDKVGKEKYIDRVKKALSRHPSASVGYVDRNNVKIGGVYAEFKPIITITSKLLLEEDLKPEHIAAIILHEVGHLFSYFETLSDVVITNKAISDAMEEMVGTKEPITRTRIINKLIDDDIINENIDASSVAALDDELVKEVIISSAIQDSIYKNDSPFYDVKNAEQQADSFAMRLGTGRYLVEALEFLLKKSDDQRHKPIPLMVQLMNFSLKSIIGLGPVYWYLSWRLFEIAEKNDPYDTPEDRFKRAKRELIGYLKKLNNSKEIKKTIDNLDAIEKIILDNPSELRLHHKLWQWITPFLRRQSSKKEQQQAVESLLNNDIYINALKLKDKGK